MLWMAVESKLQPPGECTSVRMYSRMGVEKSIPPAGRGEPAGGASETSLVLIESGEREGGGGGFALPSAIGGVFELSDLATAFTP